MSKNAKHTREKTLLFRELASKKNRSPDAPFRITLVRRKIEALTSAGEIIINRLPPLNDKDVILNNKIRRYTVYIHQRINLLKDAAKNE